MKKEPSFWNIVLIWALAPDSLPSSLTSAIPFYYNTLSYPGIFVLDPRIPENLRILSRALYTRGKIAMKCEKATTVTPAVQAIKRPGN